MSKLLDQDQRDAAIFEKKKDVTVMAGAGTGKTELLSDRYIELVAPANDKDRALDVNRIAAITFTRRAAGEIKNRIRSKLLDLKNKELSDTRKARVEDALKKLDTALMGTIHSFSDRLLALRPIEARVSPVYKVVEDESALMNETTARLVEGAKTGTLHEQWSSAEYIPNKVLLKKTTLFFNNLRKSGTEVEDIERGFNTVTGIKSLIANCVKNRDKSPIHYYEPSGYDHEACNRILEELYKDFSTALNEDEGEEGYRVYKNKLTALGKARAANNLGERARYLQTLFNLPSLRKGAEFGGKSFAYELYKALIGNKSKLSPYRELIMGPIGEALMAPLAEIYPVILDMYEDVKRRYETIDQLDLLLKLKNVLTIEHIKEYYQNLFDHLFVDEFQDTDPIQADIVLSLCEQIGSLTIIGDPKQSIYRFRRADISEFARVVDVLKNRGALETRLCVNFRSKQGLITEFNNAFKDYLGEYIPGEKEFDEVSGSVKYSPLAAHKGNAEYPSVRFLSLESEGLGASNGGRDKAAALMARYIQGILQNKGDIKFRPKDIAVLTRSTYSIHPLVRELKNLGVEVYISGGTTYGESIVVRKFIYLLSLISRESAAGRALLFSPEVSNFTAVEILKEEENEIEKWLRDLRKKKDRQPVVKTALEVMEGQLFSKVLSLGINADDDLANVYRFINLFENHVEQSGLGFDEGVDWALTWLDDPPRMSSPLRSGDNAVKILTIHQSKGLEFPVTILYDAYGRAGAFKEAPLMTSVNGKEWFAKVGKFEVQFPSTGIKILDKEKLHNDNEQKRLQYVACTRAEDFLVIPIVNNKDPNKIYPKVWGKVMDSQSNNVHIYNLSKCHEDQDFLATYDIKPSLVPLRIDESIDDYWDSLDTKLNSMLKESMISKWVNVSPTSLKSESTQEVEYTVIDSDVESTVRSGGAELGNLIHEVLYHHYVLGLDLDQAIETFGEGKEQVKEHVNNALTALNSVLENDWNKLGEVPFSLYLEEKGQMMNGIIDLILEKDGNFHIIDYKSDRELTDELIQMYAGQLSWYKKAALELYPSAQVKLSLLSTSSGKLIEIQ